jgi:hypothetical protein
MNHRTEFEMRALPTTSHGFDPIFPWLNAASNGNVGLVGKMTILSGGGDEQEPGGEAEAAPVKKTTLGLATMYTETTTTEFEFEISCDGTTLFLKMPRSIANMQLNSRGGARRQASKTSSAATVSAAGSECIVLQTGPGGATQLISTWIHAVPSVLDLYHVGRVEHGAGSVNVPGPPLQSCRFYCEPIPN